MQDANDWMIGLGLFVSGAGIDWDGKGEVPSWLQSMLDEGEELSEFLNPKHPDYEFYKKFIR